MPVSQFRTKDRPAQSFDYADFFKRYAKVFEQSLADRSHIPTLRSFFAEHFLGLSFHGTVEAGTNDENFGRMLDEGYAFYKAIGTTAMRVETVVAQPLHRDHDRIEVSYTAEYRRPGGEQLSIPFSVVYLTQRRKDGAKIFAFIAGDEMELYRQYGLVDADGKPK